MEKNNKTEIFNNLQNTLNLLDKIDLTGGDKLNPDELKNRVDLYIQTKEQILNKIKTIYDRLGIFSEEYNKAMDGWRQSYQQYEDVSNDLNESKSTNTSLTEEKENLQGKVKSSQDKIETLQGKIKTLTSSNNQLSSQLTNYDDLETTNVELSQQLAKYQTDYTQLQAEMSSLNQSNDDEIAELQNSVNSLFTNNEALNDELNNYKKSYDELQENYNILSTSNKSLSNDIQQWDAAYNQLKFQNATLTTELENMRGIEDDIDMIGSLIVRLANAIRPR